MKTFVITVSRQFPSKHIRKGEETNFVKKILNNYTCKVDEFGTKQSLIDDGYDKEDIEGYEVVIKKGQFYKVNIVFNKF